MKLIKCACMVVTAVAVAACSANSTATDSRHASARQPTFRSDLVSYSLPLDAYTVTLTQEEYAQTLVYAACMKSHQIEVPIINPADYNPPNKNAEGYKLFSVAIASKYGYHNGPAKRLPTPSQVFNGVAQKYDEQCSSSSQKKVSNPTTGFVQGLSVSAYETAIHAVNVVSAARKWHACMLPLGIGDLPSDPSNMPTERLAMTFGLGGPPNPRSVVVQPPTQPSPAEIRMATSDAQCRDESRYTATLYGDQVSAQLALMSENESKLSEALAAKEQESSTIAAILRRYGR